MAQFSFTQIHSSQPNFYSDEVVIASGTSITDAINLGGCKLISIQIPSAWTTANLTFQASYDGVTYADMYFEGVEITETAAPSRYIVVDPVLFAGSKFIKIRSGTSGTPVNQAADRTLGVVARVL